MVSKFLQARYAKQVEEFAGKETVEYLEYDDSSKDDLTGDVDESKAYSSIPKKLPAIVDFSPSKATRDRIGQDIKFEAVLHVASEHAQELDVTIKIGDAFILPTETNKYYVERIQKDMQAGQDFIVYMIALSRRSGGR